MGHIKGDSKAKVLVTSSAFSLVMGRKQVPETYLHLVVFFFLFGATAPQWARASSFTRFLGYTQRCITVGRTPLDE